MVPVADRPPNPNPAMTTRLLSLFLPIIGEALPSALFPQRPELLLFAERL